RACRCAQAILKFWMVMAFGPKLTLPLPKHDSAILRSTSPRGSVRNQNFVFESKLLSEDGMTFFSASTSFSLYDEDTTYDCVGKSHHILHLIDIVLLISFARTRPRTVGFHLMLLAVGS